MRKFLRLFMMAVQGSEKEFTTGSINRAIFLLSVPMVLEMMMESLFAVVDVFLVSNIGTDAVATIGLTETVITLVYSIAFGLSMAATAMVSRRIGEKDPDAAARAAFQSLLLGVGISVVLGILGFIFAEDILRLMGASESVIATGSNYTRILLGSNIVIMMLFLLNGIFRGAGDASLAMRSLILANGLNIILDPLFIFGIGPFPELGVTGAAVATTIGRGVGVSFQLYILLKGSSVIRILRKHLIIQWNIIRRLIRVALGGTGQYIIASASWIFLMRIVAEFGSEVVAGYTIAIRLIIFTILPSWGMANAAATLVGQNLGAGKPDRAEISVWRAARLNMIFLLTVSVFFFFGATFFISLFSNDPVVIESGALCLKVISVGYIFFAYGMVISQAFNGAGDTRTPTIINLICFWLIEIPLGYLLAVQIFESPFGVYCAIATSETILAVICIYLFRKGKWKLVSI
jgi:putative MATE family efflux protein